MQLRVARHSSNLIALEAFYTHILGLTVTGRFVDHKGYDGMFIGGEGAGWQLEFTSSHDAPVHQFDADDLLVFYPESMLEYQRISRSIQECGLELFQAKNPYWATNGICVKDPDGFGIVISQQRING